MLNTLWQIFHFYVGNILSYLSASNGIRMIGSSSDYGWTINIESKNIDWNTTSCEINTVSDGSI